jgi:hypothetical protein
MQQLMLAGRALHFSERTYPKAIERCAFASQSRAAEILRLVRSNRIERKRADAECVLRYLNDGGFAEVERGWGFAATSHWETLRAEVTAVTPVTLK